LRCPIAGGQDFQALYIGHYVDGTGNDTSSGCGINTGIQPIKQKQRHYGRQQQSIQGFDGGIEEYQPVS
jgi:hypothetical protein